MMIGKGKFKIENFMVLLLLWTTILVQSPGKEIIALGDEDGIGALIYPGQAKEGPDRNIYVYDQKDAFIKIYSPEGKFLKVIGGSAEGPGFIKRTDGVNIGFTPESNLFFTEYFGGHPWITIMALDGKFHNTLHLKVNAAYFGIENVISLPDGGFLIEFAFIGESQKTKKYFLQTSPKELCRIDSKGQIISSIRKTSYFTHISKLERGANLEIPFTPLFKWCPFRNDTIIFTDGVDQYLTVLNYKGDLINKIKILIPEAQKVTGKDLDKWREERKKNFLKTQRGVEWYSTYGNVIEEYKDSIYPKKPILEDITATPGGNILITGTWNEKKSGRNFWLIDENGKLQAEIVLDIISVSISRNFIFFIKTDTDVEDNEVVYCFKRSGEEHKDLLSMTDRVVPCLPGSN